MLRGHLNTFGNRFALQVVVFSTAEGAPVGQSNFRARIWMPAVSDAGLEAPAPRVDDLRHTAASFMAAADYTLLEAAQQLGNSAVEMTAHYSHVFKSHRQKKVAGLDGLVPDSTRG